MDKLTTTISQLIDSQFPEFVRDNHPRFLEFMRSYYEWMESQEQVLNHSANLLNNQDIDFSQDKYLEQLFREFLVNFPRNIVADKANLLKNIRQFYSARGTEKSFELFFRLLYGLNPEFYYPRTDILKVSDGKWIKPKAVRISLLNGSPNLFISNRIRGTVSNATAFVERLFRIQKDNTVGYELVLNQSSITGDFISDEIIELDVPNTNVTAVLYTNPIGVTVSKDLNPTIEYSGNGYSVGQKFKIVSPINQPGVGLEIEITSVGSLGQIQKMRILDPGLGYSQSVSIKKYVLFRPEQIYQDALIDIEFGPLISYDGYYLNEDGQLSVSKFIHDGEFYQQFSYVIYVNETIDSYRSAIKEVLHPAGFKLYGGFRTQNLFNASTKLNEITLQRNINHRRLSIDTLNLSVSVSNRPNLGTNIRFIHEPTKDVSSHILGPSRYSIYRDRYRYKPVAKYNANNELPTIPNYFGIFGDLSMQLALTPVSVFDQAGLTPANIETMMHLVTNILPDAVIIKS